MIFNGQVIAETSQAKRVIETAGAPAYYFPPEDVRMGYLRLVIENSSLCEWKGWASYYRVQVGDQVVENAARSYHDPNPEFESIKGYLSFYAAKMEACRVGAEKARPQPGVWQLGNQQYRRPHQG